MKSIEAKRAHREQINARRREKQREYYHQWYQRNGRNRAEDYLLKSAEYTKQHRLEVNVRVRFRNYIYSGAIERPTHCSICGGVGTVNAHHPDYDKPFEVIWCCSSCHKRIHLGGDLQMEIRDYAIVDRATHRPRKRVAE